MEIVITGNHPGQKSVVQQTCLVFGFACHGFAYSWKNCDTPHTLQCSSLSYTELHGLVNTRGCNLHAYCATSVLVATTVSCNTTICTVLELIVAPVF